MAAATGSHDPPHGAIGGMFAAIRWLTPLCCAGLVLTCGASLHAADAVYRLDVNNTWSTTSHPGLFPHEAHFSWLGGGTHNAQISFWEEGEPASPGMKQMAETGVINKLVDEIVVAKDTGHVGSELAYREWFCPEETVVTQCGPTSRQFEISVSHPRITLATMLGPSPDWFVGVSGLSLRESGQWLPEVVVELYPYDGGTRSANEWNLFGPENTPPEPIQRITSGATHLIGPQSLGQMTFTLIEDNTPPPSPLDCNLDDRVDVADLTCVAGDRLADTLSELNLLAGDFDGVDGVAFSDFLVLSENFGAPVDSYVDGDIDLDGVVQFSDFLVLSRNFGQAASLAAVPEPTGLLQLFVGLILVGVRRPRPPRRQL